MSDYPKRRKHKDNPYILENNNNLYFVIFKDSRGVLNKVQITKIIYDTFDKFELDDLSELNEYDNHIEHSEVYEENLYHRAIYHDEAIDDYIIRKSSYEDLMNAINQLSDVQKRRIKKYYFEEKNQIEIAEEENTTHQAIDKSLKRAIKNLKKFLKK